MNDEILSLKAQINDLKISNELISQKYKNSLQRENELLNKLILAKKKVNILSRCIPYYNYKAMHSAGKITDEELEVLESV